MNCGRSSSVEWKLPKLQRRVRFPSPAPAPPGHAPGGFVMPTSHPPSMRRDNRRNTLPARAGARGSGTKLTLHAPHATSPGTKLAPHARNATSPGTKLTPHEPHGATSGTKLTPHEPHGTSSGTKLTLQAQNLPIWRVLLLLGEFYPVFVANKSSMANFVPLPPATRPARHHSRYKTRPARPARHQSRYKTRPARPKSPNLARFALAGRVLSRFCCQQAEHGEFSPAQTPAPPPARKKQHPHTTHRATR